MFSLFICWQLCAKSSERICMNFSGKVSNEPVNKRLNFGGDPGHRLDSGIVFRICDYWEIRKVVSTDCAAQHCSAWHVLAGIAIATMTSLRHRPTIYSHDRRALAEVCTVPVLLVLTESREDVSPAAVQWSNIVVEMTVVRVRATPLLGLHVVSVMQMGPPPWIVQ